MEEESRAAFATPNEFSPPPPPSAAPARPIIAPRSVIGRAIDDGRRRVVAWRFIDSAGLRSIAAGVAGLRSVRSGLPWCTSRVTGPRPIGSCLPRCANAEVAGDRIAAAAVLLHLAL